MRRPDANETRSCLRPRALAVLLLGALCLVVAGCGSSSSAKEAPSLVRSSAPAYGTLVDQPVPVAIERVPLVNQRGERLDLASFRGKTVMLVPFLTLCAETCPLATGILLQVERALEADGASSKVQIVEISVDPRRDSPARLAAYARLTHAGWELVRAGPADLAKIAGFFGFSYRRTPEDDPPSIDWWTGKPLTYDVEHSDNYFVIDPAGEERVVQEAAPDYQGKINPKLQRFLDAEGRENQAHPPRPDWTTADALKALGHVMREELPRAATG